MKILIEESVLRQALEALIDFNQQSIGGIALPAEIDTAMDALRDALEAAEKVEPVVRVWVGKVEGADCRGVEFADMPEESAWNWMRLVDGEHDLYTHPAPAAPKITDEQGRPMTYWGGLSTPEIKPHQIAQLVNTLRDIAIKYHDHQSLRERLAGPVCDLWRTKE